MEIEYLFYLIAKGETKKKRKKVVKVKRKNKINTEEMSAAYSQPVDLSATFGEPHHPLLPSPNQMQ